MTKPIIDTGAFVSLFNQRDQYHEWAVNVFRSLKPPFYTTEAVVTEVCFLLPGPAERKKFLAKIQAGVIVVDFQLSQQIESILRFIEVYADRDLDLADATILRMSELIEDCRVFTTDGTDFAIYRRHGRRSVPFTAPPPP